MKNRFTNPINWLIFASLLLVIFFTVLLVLTAQNLTEKTLTKSSNLVSTQHQKLHHLMNMHIAGQSRTIHLQQMLLLYDDFEKDEALMNYYQNASDYVSHRDQIADFSMETPYEMNWMQHLLKLSNETAPLQNRIAQLAMNQDRLLARHLLTTQGMALLNEFTDKVNEFSVYQLEEIHSAMRAAGQEVDNLISKMLILAIAIIVLSSGLATFIIQKFNRVNHQLKSANELLEQRVQERTLELTQTQQALIAKNRELEALSTTDSLTGLNNRYRMEQFLTTAHQRFLRHGEPYQVMFLDVDHFKSVNDRFGHDVGDQILQQFAQILSEKMAPNHLIGRWGGEEFIALCANEHLTQTCQEAEQLRQAVSHSVFAQNLELTTSIGVAQVGFDDKVADDVINRADIALYKAKHTGRNQVTCQNLL